MALSPKWSPATLKGKAVPCQLKRGMYNPWADTEGGIGAITLEDSSPTTTITPDDENLIYSIAGIEVKPNFPGGLEKFYQFFNNNFKIPDEEGLKGKVYASFIVEKDGSLSEIKILRDIGYGTGKESIRVLKLSPKWNPGKQNGKIVRVLYTMSFPIAENKTEPVKK
jgi:protein TonB